MAAMDDRGHGYAPYWEHASHGHPVAWILLFLLLAVVVGFVAAYVFRWLARRQGYPLTPAAAGPAQDVLGIVRLRYARGEIDREQFLQTTADLGGAPAAEPPPPADEASTAP